MFFAWELVRLGGVAVVATAKLLRNNKLPDCSPEIPGNLRFHRSFFAIDCFAARERDTTA
jgi:hypothetical protein